MLVLLVVIVKEVLLVGSNLRILLVRNKVLLLVERIVRIELLWILKELLVIVLFILVRIWLLNLNLSVQISLS